jgi:hypothetical protein
MNGTHQNGMMFVLRALNLERETRRDVAFNEAQGVTVYAKVVSKPQLDA